MLTGDISAGDISYGPIGLLQPLTVYPSEMVYWSNLPTVSIIQALHFDIHGNAKRVKVFWTAFTGSQSLQWRLSGSVMFLTQVWGTILRAVVNYVVIVSVVNAQREILLDPVRTNVWSGQAPQSTNSAAVTWSLAKQLYGPSGPYFIIPMSLLIGFVPTTIQWFISKRWPKIGPFRVDTISLPIIYSYTAFLPMHHASSYACVLYS
ncbi:OPT oligopeptide transporter protein-domain-containing protein [Cytidiella melzeri]|nr:OPT oligopeptide transporter protein-domain-containing protein [Cytidiella melzeri]